ncbi:hypothetical protein GCM10009700_02320 [Brevibacterium sanguinis]
MTERSASWRILTPPLTLDRRWNRTARDALSLPRIGPSRRRVDGPRKHRRLGEVAYENTLIP